MNEFAGTRITPVGHPSERRRSALYTSSVVYLSFLAIERIDLLRGKGSFGFTPELLGCIVFLVFYMVDIVNRSGKFRFSGQLKRYAELLIIFMVTVMLSLPFSADFQLSAKRVALLGIYAFSGLLCVNFLFTQRPDSMISVVVNGMVFLSIVYAACSLYDVFAWFSPALIPKAGAMLPFFRSNIASVGSVFVRARGANGDANRAGIFMIVNSYIILRYCKRPALKVTICVINVAMLALTLSRTAALCLALYVVLQVFCSKRIRKKSIFRVAIIILLIVGIVIGLYQVPLIQEAVGHTLDRLQTRDESADIHIKFIQIGISRAFSDIKILLIGNGYGASANILENGKYSNFHNAYVSFLVECGLLSMLMFILLLVYPLRKNKSLFPIIAVLMLANIPYQIYIEPYYWFFLPFMCVLPQAQSAELAEGRSSLEGGEFREYE